MAVPHSHPLLLVSVLFSCLSQEDEDQKLDNNQDHVLQTVMYKFVYLRINAYKTVYLNQKFPIVLVMLDTIRLFIEINRQVSRNERTLF